MGDKEELEGKKIPLMNEEDFKKYLEENRTKIFDDFNEGILHLRSFEGVKKFKSIRRAIRRGNVSIYGEIYPKRPFNNKKNTCKRKGHHSRTMNEIKKQIYEQYCRETGRRS